MKKSKKMTLLYLSLVLVLFVLVYFVFFYYEKVETLTYGGYYLSGTDIKKNLDDLECTENVKLEYVEDYSTLYKKNDKFYANKDKQILINYPGYSEDSNRIINYNNDVTFINYEFEKTEGFDNTILNERKIYNGVNLSSIDDLEYLFIEYETLYVNSTVMKIGDKEIPEYSIISFNNDYLSYYYKDGDKLKLDRILNIGNKDLVLFYMILDDNGEIVKTTYGDLLVKLNLKNEEIEYDVDKETIIREIEDIIIDFKPKEKEQTDYEKPIVTLRNIKSDTYSVEFDISVTDRTGQIKKNPTIDITLNDGTYLRKTINKEGHVILTGLLPDTEFGITGTFTYYDKDGSLFLATFYNALFTTKDKDQVGYITFDTTLANPEKKQIRFDEIKFDPSSDIKALYGVKKIDLELGSKVFTMGANSVNRLKNGQNITFESPNSLETNTEYTGKFVVYDLAGNIMKVNNNSVTYHTSKEVPRVDLEINESDITYFVCDINYDNPDNAEISNLRYDVYDSEGLLVISGELDGSNASIKVSDLDTNQIYRFVVYGDYDLLDGNGTKENNILGETKISTTPIASLGYGNVHFEHVETFIDSDTYTMGLNASMIDEQLLSLMTGLKFIVRDKDEHIVDEFTINDERIETLLHGEFIDIEFSNLESNSDYTLEVITIVTQGTTDYELITVSNLTEFKTIKKDAYVVITDPFINESVIDFDAQIIDVDDAIDGNIVTVKVRDYDHKLILLKTLNKNSDPEEIYIDKLEKDKEYVITFEVEEYNTGLTKATAVSNKILLEKTYITAVGLSGSIKLQSLKKQITSNNLFDITDRSAWKISGNANDNDKGIVLDADTNVITMKTKNYVTNYYYYVGNYLDMPLHVSFDFKTNMSDSANDYAHIELANWEVNISLTESNVTEYQHYEFDTVISSLVHPYIVFEIASTNDVAGALYIKDLFITSTNMLPNSISDSEYYGHVFEHTTMKAGNEMMPSYTSSSMMEGNANSNGYARITNLQNGDVYKYEYTGSEQMFIVPEKGYYQIETWGASGGQSIETNTRYEGGRGAYASGDIELSKNEILYVLVGGKGENGVKGTTISQGGYNGGGNGSSARTNDFYGGGGGATDVRLLSTSNSRSISTRIIVAAGGAGGFHSKSQIDTSNYIRYDGGGIASSGVSINCALKTATQTSGNALGQGESQTTTVTNTAIAGAGGGWYGGVARKDTVQRAASGGSSYISGHYGCIAERLHKNYQSSYLNKDKYSAKNKLVSTFLVSLSDLNEEVSNKEYYVEILENGVQILYETYSINKKNIVEEALYLEVNKNQEFTANLYVMIRGKKFKLDSVTFDSRGEIKTIYNEVEFAKIHEHGRYLVGADLKLRYKYNSVNQFDGYIDFQGHTVTQLHSQGGMEILYALGKNAVIKNLHIDAYYDTNPTSTLGSIFYTNKGKIKNLMIDIHMDPGFDGLNLFTAIGYNNMGEISNFVINIHDDIPLYRSSSLGVLSNNGILENGYYISENGSVLDTTQIETTETTKSVGIAVGSGLDNSIVRNIFTAIDVESPTVEEQTNDFNRMIGNISGNSVYGYFENNFSYLSSKSSNGRLLDSEPNFYNVPRTSKNNYYITDIPFTANKTTNVSKKASELALWSTEFYNNTVNTQGQFDVENYVPYGYYPHIIMPDCMPNQPLVELPRVESSNLVDVVNTTVIEENMEEDYVIADIVLNVPVEDYELTGIEVESMGFNGGISLQHPFLDYEILEKNYKDGQVKARVKFTNPQKHTTGYSILHVYGIIGASQYISDFSSGDRIIDMSFFNKLNDEDDFVAIGTKKLKDENFVLTKDLDFSNYVNAEMLDINSNYTGIFDGNGHSIWNMKSTNGNGIFTRYFFGTMRNINLESFVETGAQGANNAGIFMNTQGAHFENVHVNNLTIVRSTSTSNYGGLAMEMQNSYIINCSFRNINISGEGSIGETVGGIAARMYYSYVENSYISNLNIDTTSFSGFKGVGGVAGRFFNSTIRNFYVTGTINAASPNVGALGGYADNLANISNTYMNVDLFNIAGGTSGTIGYYYKPTNLPVKTLYVGNMQSSQLNDLGRIVANTPIITENYAFKEQHLNGFPSTKTDGEILLSRDELNSKSTYLEQMEWDETNWDFSEIGDNSLPLIKYQGKDEVLPYQVKNYLPTFDLEVRSIDTSATVTNATVTMVINNASNKEVTDLEIEGMIINNKTIHTENGLTTIVLEVKPSLYLDQYIVKRLKYKEGNEFKFYSLNSIIEVQFFKYIKSYEDWQGISKIVAENYKLAADIDFAGKTNLNKEVVMNRLEGLEGQNYTLKNIDITSTGSIALISQVGYISHVNFENVKIYGNGSRTGIIRVALNDINHVNFTDCSINEGNLNNVEYVGNIAMNKGTISYVNIYSNTVYGYGYVGGLAAATDKTEFHDINVYSSSVYANRVYSFSIGNIFGWCPQGQYVTGYNIHGENLRAEGVNYVGGLFGNSILANNTSVDNVYVWGYQYVGGVTGYGADYSTGVAYISGSHMRIEGVGQYISGLIGQASQGNYLRVTDSEIIGSSSSKYVSGIAGPYMGYAVGFSSIENSIVKGGSFVGAIDGFEGGSSFSYNQVYSTSVYGYDYVGGLYGGRVSSHIQNHETKYNIVNATVIAKGYNVGGMTGYNDTTKLSSSSGRLVLRWNIIANSTLRGYGNVGGVVGQESGLDSTAQQNYWKDFNYYNYSLANVDSYTTEPMYTSPIEWTAGSLNYSNGRETNDANRYRSSYILIDRTKDFTVYASDILPDQGSTQSTDYYLAFYIYQSNGSYLGRIVQSGSSYIANKAMHNLHPGGTYDPSKFLQADSRAYLVRIVVFTKDPSTIQASLTRKSGEFESDIGKTGILIGSGDYIQNGGSWNFTYTGSVLNGSVVGNTPPAGLESKNLLGISKENFKHAMNNSAEFNYDVVDQGYYPLIKANPYAIKIPLPNGSVSEMEHNLNVLQIADTYNDKYYMEMPDTVVYPSSENTVNLEFSKTDGFTVIVGDTHYIPETVMTFNYNYSDDFKYSIYDGLNTVDYVIKADDLSKKLYVDGDNYYYIEDGNIKGNTETISGDYIHIYDGIAIDKNGNTFDLKERTKDRVNYSNLTKVETKPIVEYDKKNNNIKSFAFHSLVNGNMYEKQIIIKNENTTLIGENYKTKPTNMIVDSYNDREYLLILGNDNRIYSYKEDIKYSSDFINKDIIEISSNYNNNSKLIMCRYSDGGILVFNYFNGKIILDLRKNESDFKSFISSMFMNTYDLTETSYSNQYKESKKFIKELEKTSIESVVDDEIVNYDRDYELVYNPSKDSFDVYEANTYIETSKSIRNNTNDTKYNEKSINDILYSDYKLSDNYKHLVITKNNFNIVGIISFILILFVAVIILAILKKNLKVKKAK